jgi:hypothetical protein
MRKSNPSPYDPENTRGYGQHRDLRAPIGRSYDDCPERVKFFETLKKKRKETQEKEK